MNRRDFTKKSLATSAIIAVGVVNPAHAISEILTKQNFDFDD